jgi:thioredoxin 1
MPLCCIGGVCIPYSAIIPLVIIGIQWVFQKLVNVGLIPESIGQQLNGFITINQNSNNKDEKESATCCKKETSVSSSIRRGKQSKEQVGTQISNTHNLNIPSKDGIQIIESKEDWDNLVLSTTNNNDTNQQATIICKFTAQWCKPCKTIQPYFESLVSKITKNDSSKYNHNIKIVIVDVDVCDDIASMYNIITLPTFITIENGRVVDSYTGSKEQHLLDFITTSTKY